MSDWPAQITQKIRETLLGDTRRDLLIWAHNTVNRHADKLPVGKDDVARARHILEIDKRLNKARPVQHHRNLARMGFDVGPKKRNGQPA